MPIGIEVDEVRLRQILINLIGNALKFTDSGYVKVYVECIDEKHIDGDIFVSLQFVVKDSGIGIRKDFIDDLFKPFTQQESQSTKKYGGTGLGLSITKRLVELFNGSITVESEPGKGTCFKVIFTNIKTTRNKIDTTEISTIDPRRIHFQKATVLIADDVENNRKYLASVLQDTGLEIIESHDGKETYELALIKKPDLIITDLKMPVFNGFELLDKIRTNPEIKDIPVIATSASTSVNESERVNVHNFSGILIKPIHINDVFLELIRFLPHTVSEEPVSTKKTESLSKRILKKEQLDVLRPILEKDLYKVWETFKEQQPLADVEAFAYKIKETGKQHEVELLEVYGNRLISSINSFDIATMLKILAQYPDIIKNILNG
jgi:two-component system sensor histidine kinase EvgS